MTSHICTRHCFFVLFVLGLFFCSEASATEFTGLGDLAGGGYASSARGVSADGSCLLTGGAVNQSVATVVGTTESAHGLVRESLNEHMLANRHYRGRPNAKFDLYVSGFGGEWNSYTAGGTVGLAVNVTNEVRVGGGVFASRYKEDDLDYSGEYELDAVGGTMWAGYAAPGDGPQLHVVGMMAELDNEIERGYMNGSGLDSSKGDPDGNLIGIMVRAGCEVPVGEEGSITPFASYSWTEVDIDGYTETGGGLPAQFDSRKDSAEVVKAGLEGEYTLTDTMTAWGQTAYGKRLDDDSNGISGQIVGLMDFAQPGYSLDDDWTELDLGFKWQATENLSVMLTGGSTFGSDQNPDWRGSLGVSWSLM
jgi:uncharacterized protein YhjY with autotransporter beta-barrel domain